MRFHNPSSSLKKYPCMMLLHDRIVDSYSPLCWLLPLYSGAFKLLLKSLQKVPKINETNVMFTLNCKGRLLLIEQPIVMGIINATPDSFYEGSRFQGIDGILKQAEKMYTEGAVIVDIGGQSTRPG